MSAGWKELDETRQLAIAVWRGSALLLAAMLTVVLAVWLVGRSARLAKPLAMLAALLAIVLLVFAGQQKGTVSSSIDKQAWSTERVASLRAEGKPV